MKKYFVFGFLLLLFAACYAPGCGDEKGNNIKQAKEVVASNIQEFGKYIRDTLSPVVAQKKLPAIRSSFLKTRLLYKRLEWAVEYFMPTTTRFVNGPPLPEIENEENKIFEPEGLQVIEEILYSGDSIDFGELTRQAGLLSAHARTYAAYWEAVEINEVQIWDAIKLQLFRIASLGLSGFDAALAKSSIPEIASSLLSLKNIVLLFEKEKNLPPYLTGLQIILQQTPHLNFLTGPHLLKGT
jgi:cytochrome c peroxidase